MEDPRETGSCVAAPAAPAANHAAVPRRQAGHVVRAAIVCSITELRQAERLQRAWAASAHRRGTCG